MVHPYHPKCLCLKRGFCSSSSVFKFYSCLTRPVLTLLKDRNLAKNVEYSANTDPSGEQCPAMPRESKIPSTWPASWAMNTCRKLAMWHGRHDIDTRMFSFHLDAYLVQPGMLREEATQATRRSLQHMAPLLSLPCAPSGVGVLMYTCWKC